MISDMQWRCQNLGFVDDFLQSLLGLYSPEPSPEGKIMESLGGGKVGVENPISKAFRNKLI